MPRRSDLNKVLVLGAGPIIVGQACEFDYSGTQACKALREEGLQVVLVNSNPATIMTDVHLADQTYVEPLTEDILEKIIAQERPDALLATMGGQTALNLAVKLSEGNILERYGVELIGANLRSIRMAEDRALFRQTMLDLGVPVPEAAVITDLDQIESVVSRFMFPMVVRSAYTLGGAGSGIAHTKDELFRICQKGLTASIAHKVLIEQCLIGWKEIELEVVRDRLDNFIVVCGIENFDPMGVHTGDSIAIAPIQTLSDREYQLLREAAKKVIRAIGVDCGGSNIQFAVNPDTGEFTVIEFNPRVSRSSALASKATGYPIARVAAKLAIGLTLDEIRNEIVGGLSACFEPSIDYVVTKIPRFEFGKFPETSEVLGTEMKSIGEVMAVGSTFKESIQKAIRSLEVGIEGLFRPAEHSFADTKLWESRLSTPTRHRLADIWGALQTGISIELIRSWTKIDPWFLFNLQEIYDEYCSCRDEILVRAGSMEEMTELLSKPFLERLKKCGFSDKYLAEIIASIPGFQSVTEFDIFKTRSRLAVFPGFRKIDTCAAEFPSSANYLYSTYYDEECEHKPSPGRKVLVIGSGPNRIGQGIEFDYCCVQATMALRELAVMSIMVNSNPETVSTDFDISDVLYFEPITGEHVAEIARKERPEGVILQFGGQTPINLAGSLEKRGLKILGTSLESTEIAEDRGRFRKLISSLGLRQPEGAVANSLDEALIIARDLGFPVLARPSYVIGGRAIQIHYGAESLRELLSTTFAVAPGQAVLIDRFLSGAIEIDVDAVSDGSQTVIAGIMEHIEHAGVHSGDSSCVLPPQSITAAIRNEVVAATAKIAEGLKVVGCLNVQFAVHDGSVFVLEANPRASRTLPFVSKATGVAWAKIATRVIMGERLSSMSQQWPSQLSHVAVKSVVIPFDRFSSSPVALGPEMRSTGEVMGIGESFGAAFTKAQRAAGLEMSPDLVLLSCSEGCIGLAEPIIRGFDSLGINMLITPSLSERAGQNRASITVIDLANLSEKNLRAFLRSSGVSQIISICNIHKTVEQEQILRRAAINAGIPLLLTAESALAQIRALHSIKGMPTTVLSLQRHYLATNSIVTAPEPVITLI